MSSSGIENVYGEITYQQHISIAYNGARHIKRIAMNAVIMASAASKYRSVMWRQHLAYHGGQWRQAKSSIAAALRALA